MRGVLPFQPNLRTSLMVAIFTTPALLAGLSSAQHSMISAHYLICNLLQYYQTGTNLLHRDRSVL